VKPLASGQYGEFGPGFEQLLDQLAEEGADEAAKRYLIPNRVVASEGSAAPAAAAAGGDGSPKGAGGCAPPPVYLHRLHDALPGLDAAEERCADAQGELHSAAQARAWADGDFDADHGFGLDGVGRSAH
jgi:hypothetical protein